MSLKKTRLAEIGLSDKKKKKNKKKEVKVNTMQPNEEARV